MRSINYLLLCACLLFLPVSILAQDCGTDHLSSQLLNQSPVLQLRKARFDSLMLEKVYLRPDPALRSTNLYTIPVVFHVIHNNGTENISDSLIHASIDNLNDALAHRNLYDSILGVDTQIQVCLATQDENGDSATGITRHVSTHTNLDFDNYGDSIYRISKWDGTQYLNVYVLGSICNVFPFGGCFGGLGWYPYNHGNLEDGIFVTSGSVAYTESTTLAHEVGHYLGLYHTFNYQCPTGDCRNTGDWVCDTPPDVAQNWLGCDSMQNSCQTDTLDTGPWNPYRPISMGGLGDQPDKERNFMDYSGCQYEFTLGQKDRMIAALTNERVSLLSSMGCLPGCAAPIVPDFVLSDTSIVAGDSIAFTNTTTGASQYEWFINGLPFSVAQDTLNQFNTQGTYQITLCGENQDVSCGECVTREVTVSCPIQSGFAVSDTALTSEDTLVLTNQSTGATAYEWWVNGNLVSTALDTALNFQGAGIMAVTLVATNGTCRDSTTLIYDVKCTPRATFQLLGDSYAPFGSGLQLDNTSAVNAMYEWYLNDQPLGFGNDTLLTTTAAFTGNLWLRSFNGYCYDSSEYQPFVQLADCEFRETNDWVVGSTNLIDFDSLPVQGVFAGVSTSWGNNTSASDVEGNLLWFMTNQHVYNRDKQIMVNGDSLEGNTTYYPAAISTRLPGSAHRYLIFHSNISGIFQSEVNMLGDEGRGEVLHPNQLLSADASSQMELTHHANGRDFWLLGQVSGSSGAFLAAWLVSDTGVAATPVLSNIGPSGGMYGFGDLRAAPDGKTIAFSVFNGSVGINLYDFDNATGAGAFRGKLTTDPHGPFSISFSPGSTKLYYCTRNHQELFQYDMQAGSLSDIESSLTLVGTTTGFHMAGMQMASDGNIYVGRWSGGLGAIQAPDEVGLACQYTHNGIDLYGGVSGWNLSRFPSSHFRSGAAMVWGADSLCGASQNVPFQVCNLYGNDSVWWEGLGAATLVLDSGTVARFDFGSNGYAAVVSHKQTGCGTFSDTLEVQLQAASQVNLGMDTLLCAMDSLLLQAPVGMSSYTWQDSSQQDSFWVNAPGLYVVNVVDGLGCGSSDSISVGQIPAPVVALGNDSTFCPGTQVVLDAGAGFANYAWSTGAQIQQINVVQGGLYAVTVTDQCNNSDNDDRVVLFEAPFVLNLGADTVVCPSQSLLLDAGPGFASYLWQDGSTNQTFLASSPGTHWVLTATAANCSYLDSIAVDFCVGVGAALEAAVRIYPNPTSGESRVELFWPGPTATANWQVVDVLGRTVQKGQCAADTEGQFRLDLELSATGSYWVEFELEGQRFGRRLVVK